MPDSLPATLKVTLTLPLRSELNGTVHDGETFVNRKQLVPGNRTWIYLVPKAKTPIAPVGTLVALKVILWYIVPLLVLMGVP